ncbi:MAG: hypothetical protein ACTHKV_12945 [Flavipsychrobacter sp.]
MRCLPIALITTLALVSCKKNEDNTAPANAGNSGPAYSISVSGNYMVNTPMKLVANGAHGHRIHWILGDNTKVDGDSVTHIYKTADSFRITISLDDEAYKPVAKTTIGIISGIEPYAGRYHWVANYHLDSVGTVKDWTSEKDIAFSCPIAGVVRIEADNDTVAGWFNIPIDMHYVYTTDSFVVFQGSDAAVAYPGFFYWFFKTNTFQFSRSLSYQGHGGKWEWRKNATYFQK